VERREMISDEGGGGGVKEGIGILWPRDVA
jgi:hypothetical protein